MITRNSMYADYSSQIVGYLAVSGEVVLSFDASQSHLTLVGVGAANGTYRDRTMPMLDR